MQTYVLECDSGKLYVGRTTNLTRRLTQHFTKQGARWTKKYPPRRVVLVKPGDCERMLTLRLMQRHGVGRVRGGPWCRVEPIADPIELWLEPRSSGEQEAIAEEKDSPNMSVQTLSQVDLSQWAISAPQKNKHGGNEYHVVISGTRTHPRLQVTSKQLPLRCPFGASQYQEGQGSLNVNFSLPIYLEEARKFFQNLDAWILDWAWENRNQMFTKVPTSREVLESLYTPILQPAKQDYDPLVRTKISEKCPVWVFNEGNTTKGSIHDITVMCQCTPVLSIDKIWMMSGRFGCTVRTQAVICHPREQYSLDDLFVQDEPMADTGSMPVPAG